MRIFCPLTFVRGGHGLFHGLSQGPCFFRRAYRLSEERCSPPLLFSSIVDLYELLFFFSPALESPSRVNTFFFFSPWTLARPRHRGLPKIPPTSARSPIFRPIPECMLCPAHPARFLSCSAMLSADSRLTLLRLGRRLFRRGLTPPFLTPVHGFGHPPDPKNPLPTAMPDSVLSRRGCRRRPRTGTRFERSAFFNVQKPPRLCSYAFPSLP